MRRKQDWLAAFVKKYSDTADNLSMFGIRHEDSYLALESELPVDLRHRLGLFRAYHLAGANCSDPCLLAKAAPPWLREREVTTLTLSVRTAYVFEVEGIRTVNDLADWSMAELLEAPNLGLISLANVLARLVGALNEGPTASGKPLNRREEWLGAFLREHPDTAETLAGHLIKGEDSYLARESELPVDLRRRLGLFRAHHLAGASCSDPCLLAKAAPPWLRERKTITLMLSVRSAKVFEVEGIRTVNDLADWSMAELLRAPTFGHTSLANVLYSLVAALHEGPTASARAGVEHGEADAFLEQFQRSLERLSESERDILTRRMGFEREIETLQQIGDDLGVSRQRISQIELRAFKKSRCHNDWVETFERKLVATVKDRKQPLTICGMEKEDLWFKGISSHGRFCENLAATMFKDSVHVINIDGVRYFSSSMSQGKWEATVVATEHALRALPEMRWSETAVRDLVGKRLPPEAREFAETLWSQLSPRCHFAALPGGESMFIGCGDTAIKIVRKILEESDRPLHFTKISEMARKIEKGRKRKGHDVRVIQHAAAIVGSRFGRGIYGLRRHLYLSDEQVAEIRDVAESIILSQPERQWHTSGILSELQRRSTVDGENPDKYALEIVLAGSKRIAGLGRMIWAAAGVEQDRKNIRSEVVAIIEEAGRPLSRKNIRERLERKRGLHENLIFSADFPLVRLKKGLWGVNDRDVPVKRERQLELIEILVGRLESKRCGIHESELNEFLGLDGCPARAFASIATQDSRLKRDVEGYLFLAKWGKSKRLTVKAALLQILNDVGEPPTYRETVERVEALVGRKCSRYSVTSALQVLMARSNQVETPG